MTYFTTGAQLQAALDALPDSKVGDFVAFDPAFYAQTYMGAYPGTASPLEHFVTIGADRGYKPNATFDPVFYANAYADLKDQDFNAADLLYHFLQYGLDEGRAPNAELVGFNGEQYLANNPDVAAYVDANLDAFGGNAANGAIAHYVKFGQFEGRTDVAPVVEESANIHLTTGHDVVSGTSLDDTFAANVVQNGNGEQTNQLATGDVMDGGAGTDTLNATVQAASALNNGPASAIAPETVDVEVANFTALAAAFNSGASVINAKFMNGLDKVGSIDSDVDLIVQNLNTLTDSGEYADRRNTKDLTVRFDHGSNDATGAPADLVALFDNDYLLSDSSNTTTLELRMVNNLTLADGSKPLDSVESVSFSVGTVLVETAITPEMQEMTGTTAYDALVAAIQAQLTTLGITGVTVATMPPRTTVFSDDVRTHLQGEVAGLYSPILVTSTSGPLLKGVITIDNTTTDFNGLNTQTTESSTAENPIEVGVELLKVGRGGEGGELVIGGMATDLANNWDYTDNALAEGVQVFNVHMDGDRTQFSSLSGLYSTNNTLDTVNVTWAADSRADLIIGNQNTSNNRSVNSISAPNNAGSTATDGFNSVTTGYNNALKDVRVFNAANNGVTAAVGSAAAVSTDVTLNAHLSDEVVAKYMDRTDIAANPAADNANFAYTFGAGNDALNLNISQANLAASGTSGREDFTLVVNTGAGNDTVVTQIGDGKANATTPWYVNTTIQDNLSITTGAGNDTVHANGAGVWKINAGEGNDAIYSDNSGRQVIVSNATAVPAVNAESNAVWVFNTVDQTQGGTVLQNLFDLTSAAAVADVTKVANLDLTVSFRGINVTVGVGDTHSSSGGTVNDLVINQAIKEAINNDVYLGKLLSAEDGPGHTLVVTALTDGVFSDADISVSVSNTTPISVAQGAAGAAYLSATQLTALGLTGGSAVADGRFDSAIAEDAAGTAITGAVSVEANENNIVAGLGNDVVALSTSLLAHETVNVAAAGGTATTDADVVFNASAGASITVDAFDTVIASNGVVITGGVGTVNVLNTGIQGSAGNDTINASTAAAGQTIEGLAGNDTITASINGGIVIGGDGADVITFSTTGAAADTLVFNSLVGVDTIANYTVADDSIQLSKAVYAALGSVGALTVAEFASGVDAAAIAAASTAATRITYDTTTGALSYDADGIGSGAAVQLATFTGIPTLAVTEFNIVA